MRINRFYIHKNCTVVRGIRTRVTPATERGQSFNEHGYQAGAFIYVTFTSLVQDIDKSQNFGEDSVSVQTFP